MPTPTSIVPNVYGTEVPYNRDTLRDAYAAEVMRLHSLGKVVELRNRVSGADIKPRTFHPINQGEHPTWDWQAFDYRILASEKPKKMVPWRSPVDFPCEAQFLRIANATGAPSPTTNRFSTIVGMSAQGVYFTSGTTIAPISWASNSFPHYEWSSDRVTWHPCTVEVEE